MSSNPEKPGEVSHAVLTSAKDGSYRLTSTDKKDAGDIVVLRFIALPGLPQDVFVFEAVSVIIQVFWFKRTGRRVFRMAPVHHHFEQLGWAESTVVIRFWIVSIVLALIGLSTLKLR